MFHGSAPNTSTKCRMAQFIKAFPRCKSFPSSAESDKNLDIDGQSAGENLDRDEALRSPGGIVCQPRLLRRALALVRELELAGSLDSVSALGRSLFGLDILDLDRDPATPDTNSSQAISVDIRCSVEALKVSAF